MDAIKAKNSHFIDSSLFERDYVLFQKKNVVFVSYFTTLLPHKSKPFLYWAQTCSKKAKLRARFTYRPKSKPGPKWASYNPLASPCKNSTRSICRFNTQQLKHEAPFFLHISHLHARQLKKINMKNP